MGLEQKFEYGYSNQMHTNVLFLFSQCTVLVKRKNSKFVLSEFFFFFRADIAGLKSVFGRLLCLCHWNACLSFLGLKCHVIMAAEECTEDVNPQKLFMW